MHANTVSAFTALFIAISATSAFADHGHAIEEITIQAFPLASQINSSPRSNPLHSPDSAELLKRIPGANNNANGVITGIAQYRGMYGDRVSVKLDQAPTSERWPQRHGFAPGLRPRRSAPGAQGLSRHNASEPGPGEYWRPYGGGV